MLRHYWMKGSFSAWFGGSGIARLVRHNRHLDEDAARDEEKQTLKRLGLARQDMFVLVYMRIEARAHMPCLRCFFPLWFSPS